MLNPQGWIINSLTRAEVGESLSMINRALSRWKDALSRVSRQTPGTRIISHMGTMIMRQIWMWCLIIAAASGPMSLHIKISIKWGINSFQGTNRTMRTSRTTHSTSCSTRKLKETGAPLSIRLQNNHVVRIRAIECLRYSKVILPHNKSWSKKLEG